jgi:hypothetical protein
MMTVTQAVQQIRVKLRDYIIFFSGLQLGISLVVADEIFGAKTSGDSVYYWPNPNLTQLGFHEAIPLPVYASWELAFLWVLLSVFLLIVGLKIEPLHNSKNLELTS